VDVATTGAYTLSYTVSDTAGNQVSVNRTVNVAPMGPWTFTNAGATGRLGPTQVQINTSYAGTSLEGAVTISSTHQGIQEWAVPASGTYRLETWGAAGGDGGGGHGGRGARVAGLFSLVKDANLNIVIGQMGESSDTFRAGGGGGSFMWIAGSSNPLVIAGGGGGGGLINNDSYGSGFDGNQDGQILNNAMAGYAHPDMSNYVAGAGGQAGNGGGSGAGGNSHGHAGGGAGWISNGLGNYSGKSKFSFHGGGSNGSADGGFGGGGGIDNSGGGGGGGFSGGGGSGWAKSPPNLNGPGGGGGSYNSGANQDNQAGVNEGHGKVIITYIGN
jgi:hypothetical protein